MKNKEKEMEEKLLELTKIKEEKDRQLLNLEIVIGYISTISFLTLIFIASYIKMPTWLVVVLIAVASIIFIFGLSNSLKIEQTAGYYECGRCHHKYIPKYFNVFFAPHISRTRYMKCPKCGKYSWNKKKLK